MNDVDWLTLVMSGIMVLVVGGLGATAVIYSYVEEARARKERRERARRRRLEG